MARLRGASSPKGFASPERTASMESIGAGRLAPRAVFTGMDHTGVLGRSRDTAEDNKGRMSLAEVEEGANHRGRWQQTG